MGTFELLRCAKCGLIQTHPTPYPGYDNLYSLTDREQYYQSHKTLLEKYSRRDVAWVQHYHPGGSWLDIGCNVGGTLDGAKAAGFDTYGVETSVGAQVAAVHGHKIFAGLWSQAAFVNQQFDVISIIHVLEHIHDPLPFLALTRERLAPGGHVFICLPNYASLMRRAKGDGWYGLGIDQHVWQYEPQSLARLVEAAGLRVTCVFKRSMDHDDPQRPWWKQVLVSGVLVAAQLLHWGDELCLVASKP